LVFSHNIIYPEGKRRKTIQFNPPKKREIKKLNCGNARTTPSVRKGSEGEEGGGEVERGEKTHLIVATYVLPAAQGQHTHSARTNSNKLSPHYICLKLYRYKVFNFKCQRAYHLKANIS
jgi:hypothetical protein